MCLAKNSSLPKTPNNEERKKKRGRKKKTRPKMPAEAAPFV